MAVFHRLMSRVREIMALRARQGPYRFLVRRWDDVSDIDLAVRVLQTEFFEKEISPVHLPIDNLGSILVIAPHPDDETIGAGGSLLLASSCGVKTHVLYVTDGAQENHPSGDSPADVSRRRDQEAQSACARLGAEVYRLGISNCNLQPSVEHLDYLTDLLYKLKPDVVMAPWILDSPAKHRLVNHLLWLANRRRPLPRFEVWGYQVHNTLIPNGYVDITNVASQKRSLLASFCSQSEFGACYDHIAMGMAAWNARLFNATTPRYYELFFTLPIQELLRLVERFYFADFRATYRGHSSVLSGAMAIHREVTQNGCR